MQQNPYWNLGNGEKNKKKHQNLQNKVVQLKEQRTLLSPFLLTVRKRPEIDLEEYIGNYEFSAVAKSMFSDDGQPLLTNDIAWTLHKVDSPFSGAKEVTVNERAGANKKITASVIQGKKREVKGCVNTQKSDKFL